MKNEMTVTDNARRVLDVLTARGPHEFAFVKDLAASLSMRPLAVSVALDELLVAGLCEQYRLRDRPVAFSCR
jgi:DNA-binding MarR family transcriptional regulator